MTNNWRPGLGPALCAVASVAAMAFWPGAVSAAPGPTALESLGAICQSVVGIPPDNAQHQACVFALSHYLERMDDANAVENARTACLAMGKTPDSVDLAECELSRRELKKPVAAIAEPPPGPKIQSYFYASTQEVRRREERACAELSLDPADAIFGRCVARLSAAMLEVNNPAQ
jgi:hypothetical protein